jgi:hypothetical protein
MVEDKYYYVWDDAYSGFMLGKCLGKFESEDQYKRCLATFICTIPDTDSLQLNSLWCYSANRRYYREATTDEIEWLELCIKKGMFINKPEIKMYELW